ncbi:MAG TPA: hypothetical protein ENO23_10185 [Alphaproteobacteria bacterium]|nr:hypothetical protein [Alphaproteobacteria bacterium]
MRLQVAGALVALAMTAGAAGAQVVEAGPLTLDFSGRAQVQFNTTSVDGEDLGLAEGPATTAFETRRIRFGTRFAYDEWLTGLVEADFAGGGARLTDGYIDARLADGFAVRAGQFKKPFGLIELTSSTQTLTIERSVRMRGLEDLLAAAGAVIGEEQYLLSEAMYVGRQVGVMVHGDLGPLGYAGGVFNGEGANERDVRSSKALAGRLTYGLAEPLVLGAGVSVQPTGQLDAAGDELHATAYSLDAEYGRFRGDGLHLMAELMLGDNPLLLVADEMPDMVGVQAVAAWFAPRSGGRVEGIEPLFRASWADPDTDVDSDAGLTLTPGLNLYFTGRNRFMVNGEVYLPSQDGLDAEYALVAQLQIYF